MNYKHVQFTICSTDAIVDTTLDTVVLTECADTTIVVDINDQTSKGRRTTRQRRNRS